EHQAGGGQDQRWIRGLGCGRRAERSARLGKTTDVSLHNHTAQGKILDGSVGPTGDSDAANLQIRWPGVRGIQTERSIGSSRERYRVHECFSRTQSETLALAFGEAVTPIEEQL